MIRMTQAIRGGCRSHIISEVFRVDQSIIVLGEKKANFLKSVHQEGTEYERELA